MNDAEIINLVETKGVLPAVQYVKCFHKDWSLTECKRHVDHIMDIKKRQTGTITWFDAVKMPPHINDSKILLLVTSNKIISTANWDNYYENFYNYNLPNNPTHWAYINEPKTN